MISTGHGQAIDDTGWTRTGRESVTSEASRGRGRWSARGSEAAASTASERQTYDRCAQEPARVGDGLEQDERLLETVLFDGTDMTGQYDPGGKTIRLGRT